jgi:4-hydroxy 2-oxovalerate aldolase
LSSSTYDIRADAPGETAYNPTSPVITLPAPREPSVLDVTLRDGGYVNGHTWTRREARTIFQAVNAAFVDTVEVGYLRDRHDERRPTWSCPEHFLESITALGGDSAVAVMVRPGEVGPARVRGLRDLGVDVLRVVVSAGRLADALPYLEMARQAGLRTCANLTRISEFAPDHLAELALRSVAAGAQVVYLADSNGSLFPQDVGRHVGALLGAGVEEVGFHPHDNLGLAFINSVVALEAGALHVDSSIGGIGKGGGNLRTELITAHLIRSVAAPYYLDPIIDQDVTLATSLRMLVEGRVCSLLSGLLDLNVDDMESLRTMTGDRGADHALRSFSPGSPNRNGRARDPKTTYGPSFSSASSRRIS